MPLLEVTGLEVVYQRIITAIRDVSIRVEEGSIVGIVGLNGAGKTTTLRAISGFLPSENVAITDGHVAFEGEDITGWRPHRPARAGISLVPEREKIFETLDVRSNLDMVVQRSSNGGGEVTIGDVYDLFPSLGDKRAILAIHLSGGEQQMLAIGMGLLTAPKLLLIDEASLGLAPQLVSQILDTLVEINRSMGVSILIVDQNVRAVLSIADHGYVMENGRVVFAGESEELLSHGDIQEFYLGARAESDEDARSYRDVKQYRRTRRWWG